jgi:hypothetical protein
MWQVTSMTSLREHLKKGGKVYTFAKLTNDDELVIPVIKSYFLEVTKDWTDEDLNEANSRVHRDGHDIYIG